MEKESGLGEWANNITASKPSHREQKYVPGNDPGQERPYLCISGVGKSLACLPSKKKIPGMQCSLSPSLDPKHHTPP